MFLFLYFRERECTHEGVEVERGIPSRLCTASTEPDAGPEPMNSEIMTSVETKSWTLNSLNHPGAPENVYFCKNFISPYLRDTDAHSHVAC